jgi:hypothetical protein
VPIRNNQINWDKFKPGPYYARNYREMREDDLQIVRKVRNFFAAHRPVDGKDGVDVGAGPNLYPALAMLPFCDRVDMIDYSAPNVRWLRSRRRWWRRFDHSWDSFWRVYAVKGAYAKLISGRHPLTEFRRKAKIKRGSVFGLPEERWSIGTMFFVACSLSADRAEFERAVKCFTRSLRPGAPFAAAFMTGSRGYEIDGVRFPAVPLDADVIKTTLKGLATGLKVGPIDSRDPLRPGVGMVLAMGYSRGAVAAPTAKPPRSSDTKPAVSSDTKRAVPVG